MNALVAANDRHAFADLIAEARTQVYRSLETACTFLNDGAPDVAYPYLIDARIALSVLEAQIPPEVVAAAQRESQRFVDQMLDTLGLPR